MEEERRINPRNMKFEYVLPSSWWTETADSHCLLIDVPGFKKEEVRIRADNQGHVIVSGERQANDTKILHFEQSYIVPEGCNIQGTSAILEDDTYYVIIPKKVASNSNSNSISTLTSVQAGDRVQDKMPDGADNANNNPQGMTKTDDEEDPHHASSEDDSFLEKLSKKLKRKRCLVLTALLAFSLGVVISHRYNSTPQKGSKKGADGDA